MLGGDGDDPSYRDVVWENSYDEAASLIAWAPPRDRHEADHAIEWAILRLADQMEEPSVGFEVGKLFGDPPLRYFWRLNDDKSVSVHFIEEDPNPEGEGFEED